MRRLLALALLTLAGCDAAPPTVPQDVRDLIKRQEDCRHWAGEEGYDAARRAQINAAYDKLRCAALDADETALKAQHSGNPAARKALDEARARLAD